MTILSQLKDNGPGLPHFVQGLVRDDRLYRYLKVYPLKGLCEGNLLQSNHHEGPVSPIRRLPVELLAEIFGHYVQIVDESRHSLSLCIKPHSQTTPFHLGQVCYYWRSITLSMGNLWQSMSICPPRLNHIPLIERWLDLAGEYPLTLWLRQSDRPSASEVQATDGILPLLVNRLHRWKAINFDFSVGPHKALLNLPQGAAVSLEAARIDIRVWDQASAENVWRALHSSPTLRRPEWVAYQWNQSRDHVPWHQLTHIRLDGWHPADSVLRILPLCQSVTKLALRLSAPDTSFDTPSFILPKLKDLTVIIHDGLEPVFQSFVLPSLESLNIAHCLSPGITSSPLADLICRSQCKLTKLTLCDTDPTLCEDRIIDYLRIPALRSLTMLWLRNPVTDKTIRLLSVLVGMEQLLPHLQTVALRCCSSDGLMSDMIVSRMPSLRTIHVTLLRGDTHSYERDQAMFGDIRNKGCDVQANVV